MHALHPPSTQTPSTPHTLHYLPQTKVRLGSPCDAATDNFFPPLTTPPIVSWLFLCFFVFILVVLESGVCAVISVCLCCCQTMVCAVVEPLYSPGIVLLLPVHIMMLSPAQLDLDVVSGGFCCCCRPGVCAVVERGFVLLLPWDPQEVDCAVVYGDLCCRRPGAWVFVLSSSGGPCCCCPPR